MVLEIAEVTVRPGSEDAFVAAYREGVGEVRSSPGFRSIRVVRGIESPSRFVLLIEWDDLESHTVGFRESERFTRWRSFIGPFFDGAPRVEHFTDPTADAPH
jgi:heme-degrading monooxygenase HmoA